MLLQLKVCVSLSNYTMNDETGELEFNSNIEQEVFFCDLLDDREWNVYNQRNRACYCISVVSFSGVFFSRKKLKNTSGVREVLNARIILNRGSWIDFEFDAKDILNVHN